VAVRQRELRPSMHPVCSIHAHHETTRIDCDGDIGCLTFAPYSVCRPTVPCAAAASRLLCLPTAALVVACSGRPAMRKWH
jgi:hypothetical protein